MDSARIMPGILEVKEILANYIRSDLFNYLDELALAILAEELLLHAIEIKRAGRHVLSFAV